MPAEIKILVPGYAREKNGSEFASSTVTLIRENGINVIVDPGLDRKKLLAALSEEGLSVKKINYVILTHNHSDHCLLAGIFAQAKIIDANVIFSWDGKNVGHEGKVPRTGIKIIKTPGHDQFHCSVLVKTKKFGNVAVAGDVFWWWDKQKQKTDRQSLLKLEDLYVKNKKQLTASRRKILAMADYVIPGHGEMFEVKK